MPNGGAGLLFQVLDSGPGLKGRDFRVLFDPSREIGASLPGILGRRMDLHTYHH